MRLHIAMPLRWSDLDAYGHVNNAQMLRLLEEARLRALWGPEAGEELPEDDRLPTAVLDRESGGTLTYIARQEIEYLRPIPYLRAPLDIQLWMGHIGAASFDLCYEVRSPAASAEDVLYARAVTTIVMVDSVTERPRRVKDHERAAWQPYSEEPVVMRRR